MGLGLWASVGLCLRFESNTLDLYSYYISSGMGAVADTEATTTLEWDIDVISECQMDFTD